MSPSSDITAFGANLLLTMVDGCCIRVDGERGCPSCFVTLLSLREAGELIISLELGVSLVVLLALLMLLDTPLLVDDSEDAAVADLLVILLFRLLLLDSVELVTSDEDDEDVHERLESANDESSFCLSHSDDLGDD